VTAWLSLNIGRVGGDRDSGPLAQEEWPPLWRSFHVHRGGFGGRHWTRTS